MAIYLLNIRDLVEENNNKKNPNKTRSVTHYNSLSHSTGQCTSMTYYIKPEKIKDTTQAQCKVTANAPYTVQCISLPCPFTMNIRILQCFSIRDLAALFPTKESTLFSLAFKTTAT